MKLSIIAVGTRIAPWAKEAYLEFARRMPRETPLELIEIKAEPRNAGRSAEQLAAAEAMRIRPRLAGPGRRRIVALDERGDDVTTRELAARLNAWSAEGQDVAFLIGGPDGLDAALKREADETLRLSSLTLPHALARVVLAEALYRASSLLKGHPYHRD